MALLRENDLNDDRHCFACGPDNPHGLRMKVFFEDQAAKCRLVLPQHFQGWSEIAHGGVVSTILDEIMAYAVIHHLGQGVTLRMETAFRKAVPLGQELIAEGRVTLHKGRRAEAAGELRLAADQTLLANSQARWLLKLGPDGGPLEGGLWTEQGE